LTIEKSDVLDKINFESFYRSELDCEQRLNGDELPARCPFHDDDTPSLYCNVKTGLYFCQGCGAKGDVFSFVQERRGVTFQEALGELAHLVGLNGNGDGKKKEKARAVEANQTDRYDYTFEDGTYAFSVLRFEEEGREKTFRQWHYDFQAEKWIENVQGVRLVPFNLPEVLTAKTVFIVEGEKDVLRLKDLGLVATCNPMGSGKWRDEYGQFLKGKKVIIIPDNDKPGRDHAEDVRIKIKPFVDSVRLVELPGLPQKGDVSDWLDAGGTIDQLREIVAKVPEETKPKGPWDSPVSIKRMATTAPPPFPWFAKQRMPQGRGLLLTGIGGSSKTTLLKQMAIGAVLGRVPWEWEIVKTGKAVLVLTEDTADDVHDSIFNMCKALNCTDEEIDILDQNLIIHPKAGEDCLFLVKDDKGVLVKSDLFNSFVKEVLDLGDVVFVGFDPALSLSEGDELKQDEQRRLGKMVDDMAVRTGATCVLVSHATKASNSADEITSHNSRGGGAITDAVRGEYALRNMTAKEAQKAGIEDVEERKRLVQFVATKGNRLPPAAYVPVWFRRGDSGVLSQVEVSMDGKEAGAREMKSLAILKDLSQSSYPSLAEWRNKCAAEGLVFGPNEEAVVQCMKRIVMKLKDLGLIKKGIGRGIWVPVEHDTDED
jgi:hypothetical protein